MERCTFAEELQLQREESEVLGRVPSAVDFAREQLGFEADEPQRAVLASTAKRGILNCTRQWGKSTVTAIKALHRALTVPEELVLISAPAGRQSGEFLLKVEHFARRLEIKIRGDGNNDNSLLLENGSRIVGLPGEETTLRGYSAVGLLLIDEAAQVPDALYKTLRPMLAVSNGELWLMSTPFGRRGFFCDEWTHGGKRWERISVKATECPRIPPEFLEEERTVQGSAWFGQEYLCEFIDDGHSWLDRGVVEAALTDEEPLDL